MCSGSNSRDQAVLNLKSLLSKVHVGGKFRIENSKIGYAYVVCKVCRNAKCGIEQKGREPWRIKSVTTALGFSCLGGQSVIKEEEQKTTSSTTLAQDASAIALAALNSIDVHQLLQAVSPDVQQLLRHQLLQNPSPDLHQVPQTISSDVHQLPQAVSPDLHQVPQAISSDVHQVPQAISPDVHQLAQPISADVHQPLQAVSPPKIECSLCRDLFEEVALARCGNGTHRFCGTCFCKLVADAIRGPSKGVFIASGCMLPCTWCTPSSSCDVQKYAPLLSKECFSEWMEAVTAMKVEAESVKWAERLKKKDEEVFEALVKAGAASEELQVKHHYDHIAETLIQPTCPACGMYIPEFDACCALQCGRRDGTKWKPGYGCGAHICAWCLCVQASEDLMHTHVTLCDHNPVRGSMYPPTGHPVAWKHVMHEFARKRVKEYILRSVPSGLQQQVYSKVQTNNQEIGLGLQAWGTIVSDGFRPSRDVRVPRQPFMEDNVTTLLAMGIVVNRAQALSVLEAAENDLETAVTFAMAARR